MIRAPLHRLLPPLLAALLLVWASAPASAQQRGSVQGLVSRLGAELRDFVAGPPPEPGGPRELRPCGSLYGPEARQIARGPELLNSYDRWIRASAAVVDEIGPLPLCFETGHDTLTSHESRFLLGVNNDYLRRHRDAGFVLTGYSDPRERDPALARKRAEEIQLRSAERQCRYHPRPGPARVAVQLYRKVEYSPDPAASRCRPLLPPR